MIVPLIIVGIGLIGWVLSLRSDVTTTVGQLEAIHEEVENLQERLDEKFNILHQEVDVIRDIQALQENEMRTIMSDHSGFNEVLQQLGKSGLLPSGERREYGGYSN